MESGFSVGLGLVSPRERFTKRVFQHPARVGRRLPGARAYNPRPCPGGARDGRSSGRRRCWAAPPPRWPCGPSRASIRAGSFPRPGATTCASCATRWGVPHVFGRTDPDVAYGLAWAHAEDDFETIQGALLAARGRWRRASGREGAPNDYLVQLLRVREVVEARYDARPRARHARAAARPTPTGSTTTRRSIPTRPWPGSTPCAAATWWRASSTSCRSSSASDAC